MNSYIAGSLVTVSATFTNASGTPTDPTTVTLQVGRLGSGVSVSTYSGGTTTGTYAITKVSTGNYAANIDTTSLPQAQWTYEWYGSGTLQAINYGVFAVTSNPI